MPRDARAYLSDVLESCEAIASRSSRFGSCRISSQPSCAFVCEREFIKRAASPDEEG